MNKLALGLMLVLGFIENGSADTQVYKCLKEGVISYSQVPCNGQTSEKQEIKTYSPSKEQAAQSKKDNLARQKEYDRLVRAREKDEAKLEAARRQLAKQIASKQKQCDNLKLKTDWAREDYRGAQPRAQEKMRQKLKRTEQVYAMNCK